MTFVAVTDAACQRPSLLSRSILRRSPRTFTMKDDCYDQLEKIEIRSLMVGGRSDSYLPSFSLLPWVAFFVVDD